LTPTMDEWARWAVPKLKPERGLTTIGLQGSYARIVDVDGTELGELLLELLGSLGVGYARDSAIAPPAIRDRPTLDLLLALLALALLLDVETEVLKEEHLAVLAGENRRLDLLTDTVGEEGHVPLEQLGELGRDGLERVLLVGLAVGAAEMGHEDDGFGAWQRSVRAAERRVKDDSTRLTLVESILDGGEGGDDALCTGQYGVTRGPKEVRGETSAGLTAGLVISPVFLSWLRNVSTAQDNEPRRRDH
jgi:hypothetical protein